MEILWTSDYFKAYLNTQKAEYFKNSTEHPSVFSGFFPSFPFCPDELSFMRDFFSHFTFHTITRNIREASTLQLQGSSLFFVHLEWPWTGRGQLPWHDDFWQAAGDTRLGFAWHRTCFSSPEGKPVKILLPHFLKNDLSLVQGVRGVPGRMAARERVVSVQKTEQGWGCCLRD